MSECRESASGAFKNISFKCGDYLQLQIKPSATKKSHPSPGSSPLLDVALQGWSEGACFTHLIFWDICWSFLEITLDLYQIYIKWLRLLMLLLASPVRPLKAPITWCLRQHQLFGASGTHTLHAQPEASKKKIESNLVKHGETRCDGLNPIHRGQSTWHKTPLPRLVVVVFGRSEIRRNMSVFLLKRWLIEQLQTAEISLDQFMDPYFILCFSFLV